MQKHSRKKIAIVWLLTLAMFITILPVGALANEEEADTFKVEFVAGEGTGQIFAYVGEGQINSGDMVAAGADVVFRAEPSGQGFVVDGWVVNGVAQSHKNLTHTVTNLSADLNVVVNFAESDGIPDLWKQAGTTTLAQGNIARTGTTVSQYDNGANVGTRATNGSLPTSSSTNHWNTWGAAATIGSQASPVWIYVNWTQPYSVQGTRVLWHIFNDAGVRWPNAANVQYLLPGGNPAQEASWANVFPYTPPANDTARVGVADVNSPIGVDGRSGTNTTNRIWPAPSTWAANTVWNIVKFPEPVTTQGIRLLVYGAKASGTSPGIGVGAWEVFGTAGDPELRSVSVAGADSLMVDATATYTATVADSGLTGLAYEWSVNSSVIAIVGSNTGSTVQVEAKAVGDAVLTCTVTHSTGVLTAVGNININVRDTSTPDSLEINPVNGANPMRYTVNGGPGSPRFRDFFRVNTENTFLRPGESVTYNYIARPVGGVYPNPVWSITGNIVGSTAIDPVTGKLTTDVNQTPGDIFVTATIGTLSATAKVTVRVVSDANGYDQSAKWGSDAFLLSEVVLNDSLWSKNRDILFRYLLQGNREEKHLKFFYDTAGITTLPVAINGRAAGSAVSALTAPDSWDGVGYATTSRVWQRALSGHGSGHYMSAISQAYQMTPNATQKASFLAKMKLMVDQLGYCQDVNIEKGSYMYGFLSAYSEHQFDVLEENKASVQGNSASSSRSSWAIFYTQHKIIQGLLDIYTTLKGTADDATAMRALDIATKMGDWTYLRLNRWTQADRDNMWNVYSDGEIGGIGQPIMQLYFITGDPIYKETASFFEHNNQWNTTGQTSDVNTGTGATAGYWNRAGTVRATTRSTDRNGDGVFVHFAINGNGSWLNNKHANTVIPMIVSALRQYEADQSVNTPVDILRITGRAGGTTDYTLQPTHYYDIAKNFWNHVFTSRISPIGGTAHGEIWPSNTTGTWSTLMATGGGGSQESCTTINMMQLAAELFRHEQRAVYMDYYERALLNHVMPTLAQYDTSTTRLGIDYFFFFGTNATRSHARYGDGSCCNSSGMESHLKYNQHAYHKTKDGTGLYVNLYMPTTLNWTEKDFQIVQETDYLNGGFSKFTVNGEGPLDIMLRVPFWIEKGFEVKVNDEVIMTNAAKSSYVTLKGPHDGEWEIGDVIEVTMPFSVRIERGPQNTTDTQAALFYGPYMMVQQPGVAARPSITGLDINDLDAEFALGTRTGVQHSFGNYSAFSLVRSGQNYFPMYTATSWNTTYCAHFAITRITGELVTVNRSVVGGNGSIATRSNNTNVNNNASINRGSHVTFTATPDAGYRVKEWKYNGLAVENNTSNVYVLSGLASNATVTVEFELIPCTHIPGARDDLLLPTCIDEGEWEIRCSLCDELLDSGISNALGHTPGPAATCTTAQICTVCNIELAPALGHTPGAAATCTAAQVCTVCGVELAPALGHTPGAAATCTTAQVCTVCGVELAPALGHTPGAQTEILAPTCTVEGAWEIRCTVCDALLDSGKINALGHTPGEWTEILAPTCVDEGAWEIRCNVCDALLDSGSIEELGHTPGERTVVEEPSRTEEGAWEIHCEVCDELLDSGTIAKLRVGNPQVLIQDFYSIKETYKGSNVWVMTFFAVVSLYDENDEFVRKERVEYTVDLNGNNANQDGAFVFDEDHDFAGFTLMYDIKGNGKNIKELKIRLS